MKLVLYLVATVVLIAAKDVSGMSTPFDALAERELQALPCSSDNDCAAGKSCCEDCAFGNLKCFRDDSPACTDSCPGGRGGSGGGGSSSSISCSDRDFREYVNDCLDSERSSDGRLTCSECE